MTDKKPLPEPLRLSHLYLLASHDEAQTKSRKEEVRDVLKPWLIESFDPDEDGNYFYEFPDPINVDGIWYKGLMAQRRASEFVDDNKVIAYLAMTTDELYNRCVKQVVHYEVDYDEVYAANQEGLISDEDIDSFVEIQESFALVKVKK